MSEKPCISIIVPVYNVEELLPRCIDSLIKQTYPKIEIWLVDDGATDMSGSVCDKYADTDDRIKVIHKKNGGLSDARNAALDRVDKDYVTFIDSDDWVSRYYIEHLWDAMERSGADISCSWFDNIRSEEKLPSVTENITGYEVISPKECLKRLLYQKGVETSACGKLYKTALFDGIRYPKGKLYEDVPVTHRLIERSSRIALIDNIDYFYWQRPGSIQYQAFTPKKLDAVRHVEEMRNVIIGLYPELQKAADCRCFSTVCNILFQIPDDRANRIYIDRLWKKIRKYRRSVIFDHEARKKNRYGAVASLAGYHFMLSVYRKTQMRGKNYL